MNAMPPSDCWPCSLSGSGGYNSSRLHLRSLEAVGGRTSVLCSRLRFCDKQTDRPRTICSLQHKNLTDFKYKQCKLKINILTITNWSTEHFFPESTNISQLLKNQMFCWKMLLNTIVLDNADMPYGHKISNNLGLYLNDWPLVQP